MEIACTDFEATNVQHKNTKNSARNYLDGCNGKIQVSKEYNIQAFFFYISSVNIFQLSC